MELAGRVALVTGAGRRVGRALALALAADGMRVAIHFHASREEAEAVAAEVRGLGTEAWTIGADLREPRAPEQLVHAAARHFGTLDVLVNSAAVMVRAPLADITVEQWDATLDLNLRAPFFCARAAAAVMRERGGAIINLADLAGLEVWPGYIAHGISKAGVIQMTRALARVLAPSVRVNAIAPGAVLLPDDWTAADAERLARTTPLRRLGSPADVVGAMRYLLHAEYVTGEVIIVDGGRHVR